MTEAIAAALISGAFALIGTILTVRAATRKAYHAMQISLAVTDEKLAELTREVREHNGFARRMPVVEEQIRDLDRRLTGAEKVLAGRKEKIA